MTIDPPFLARAYEELLSDDPELRRSAVTRIAALPLPDVPGRLRGALSDGSADVRAAAFSALDGVSPPDDLEIFLSGLSDPSPTVRFAVTEIVGARLLRGRQRGAWPTGAPPERTPMARLRATLRDDTDASVRGRALRVLAGLSAISAAELRAAAAGEGQPLVMEALSQLSHRGEPGSLDTLSRALRSGDPEIRRAAVQALDEARFRRTSESDRRRIRSLLAAALRDREGSVRRTAAHALSVSATAAEAGALDAALQDDEPSVRRFAAEAIAAIRPRSARTAVARALSSERQPEARLGLRFAEVRMRPTRTATVSATRTSSATPSGTPTCTFSSDEAGTATAEAIVRFLSRTGSPTPTASPTKVRAKKGSRTPTASATGTATASGTATSSATATATEDMRAFDELLAGLASPYRRAQARGYLAALGVEAAPALGVAVAHATAEVRAEAAALVADLRLPGFEPALRLLTRDSDPAVRAAAERALMVLSGPPQPATPVGDPRDVRPVPSPSAAPSTGRPARAEIASPAGGGEPVRTPTPQPFRIRAPR